MIRVLIDGIVFEKSSQIGIWRVFYEVMRRLVGRIHFTLWLRAPAVQPIPPGVEVISDHARCYSSWKNIRLRAKAEWSRRKYLPFAVRVSDVFHSTYFTPCPVRDIAVVTTVHDMIAEIAYPYSGGAAWLSNIKEKKVSIDSAHLCVAVSEATAVDLSTYAPESAEKIRVIRHGHEHLTPAEEKVIGGGPYALFVGHRDGYKNFVNVLEAMTQINWPVGLGLRVIGPPLAEHEWGLIRYYGLVDRVVAVGRVNDKQLASEYASAVCFIYPSRLEGFGLPILEAQLNGCPVVCSDIPVFREVAGEAAIFFDSRLGERLAEAVSLVSIPDARNRMADAGRDNIRRFSWDKAAEQWLTVYHEAASALR